MVVGISFQSCQMMWLQSSNKRCCETAERRGGSGRFGEEQVGDASEGYGGKWRGCCSWSVKNIWQLWEGWRRLLGFICNAKKVSEKSGHKTEDKVRKNMGDLFTALVSLSHSFHPLCAQCWCVTALCAHLQHHCESCQPSWHGSPRGCWQGCFLTCTTEGFAGVGVHRAVVPEALAIPGGASCLASCAVQPGQPALLHPRERLQHPAASQRDGERVSNGCSARALADLHRY